MWLYLSLAYVRYLMFLLLYGSLGQTGVGHGSGKAVILGLAGYDPETIDADLVDDILAKIENEPPSSARRTKPPASRSSPTSW